MSPVSDLHVIIVTYKVRDLLRDCLASLRESRLNGLTLAVTVIDNDSADGSAEMVEQEFPEYAVVRSGNLGYPHGNNLGFARFTGRYQLMLNPDTLLPPSALADAIRYMDAHPDIGAMGPRLVLADGGLDLACRRSFPTPLNALAKFSGLARLFPRSRTLAAYNLTYLDPRHEADVDSLVGAFMLLRTAALEQIGGLDETFFMYGEDLDLCYRLHALGWRVVYWPDVTVLHYKRASSSQSDRAGREFFRAMRIFYDKHYADTALPGQPPLVRAGIGALQRFVGHSRGS